jgi:hypothetical protein
VRSTTPSPATQGSGSEKLMVRKNAMAPYFYHAARIPAKNGNSAAEHRIPAFAGTSGTYHPEFEIMRRGA